jgi:peptide deformylase
MVKEILVYPDKKIHTISPDLREFDDELFKLLQDMKDTMIENNIDALAAIQIGVSKAVVLLRDDNGDFFRDYKSKRDE